MAQRRVEVNGLALSEISEINLRGCGYVSKPFIGAGPCTPRHHYIFAAESDHAFEFTFESARRILKADACFLGCAEGWVVQRQHDLRCNRGTTAGVGLELRLVPGDEWARCRVCLSLASRSRIGVALRDAGFYRRVLSCNDGPSDLFIAYGRRGLMDDLFMHLKDLCSTYMDVEGSVKLELLEARYTSPNFDWWPAQTVGIKLGV